MSCVTRLSGEPGSRISLHTVKHFAANCTWVSWNPENDALGIERGSRSSQMAITTSLLAPRTPTTTCPIEDTRGGRATTDSHAAICKPSSLPLAGSRIMMRNNVAVALLCRLSNACIVLSLLPRDECVECHFCTFVFFSPNE